MWSQCSRLSTALTFSVNTMQTKWVWAISITYVFIVYHSVPTTANGSLPGKQGPIKVDSNATLQPIAKICHPTAVYISQPCLCYAHVNETGFDIVGSNRNSTTVANAHPLKCAMTYVEVGRLGNVMSEYATLYGLARMNKRPAFISPGMARVLQKHFKITIPAMPAQMYNQIKWNRAYIHDWMEESYRHMEGDFIQVVNAVPNTFTFYDQYRQEIRREFTPHDDLRMKAQTVLRQLRGNRTSVTFVGVHVRRGDYVRLMSVWHGVVGDKGFFAQATHYFRSRYPDAIFVVASNDMKWCKENIPNDKGDVFYIGNNNESDPFTDFSVLVSCNHTIFTIGTYGHWVAYVTGGEVVYLANFTLPDSPYRVFHKTANIFPPHWIPIQADLSHLANITTTAVPTTKATTTTTRVTSKASDAKGN